MRNAAIALLAVPILAAIYAGALLRRSLLSRLALAVGLSAILGGGIIGAGLPSVTKATPTTPIVPLTRAEFRTVVATGASVVEPVAIHFTTPMNPGSVAAAVKVDPPTPVELAWDAAGQTVTIAPTSAWAPGVYPHRLGPGGRARRDRAAPRTTGPGGVPDAATRQRRSSSRRHPWASAFRSRPRSRSASRGSSIPGPFAPGSSSNPTTPGTVEMTGSPEGSGQLRLRPGGAAEAGHGVQARGQRRARPRRAGARSAVDRRPHRQGARCRPVPTTRRCRRTPRGTPPSRSGSPNR